LVTGAHLPLSLLMMPGIMIALLASEGLHRWVERPSLSLGRRFMPAARWVPGEPVIAAHLGSATSPAPPAYT